MGTECAGCDFRNAFGGCDVTGPCVKTDTTAPRQKPVEAGPAKGLGLPSPEQIANAGRETESVEDYRSKEAKERRAAQLKSAREFRSNYLKQFGIDVPTNRPKKKS